MCVCVWERESYTGHELIHLWHRQGISTSFFCNFDWRKIIIAAEGREKPPSRWMFLRWERGTSETVWPKESAQLSITPKYDCWTSLFKSVHRVHLRHYCRLLCNTSSEACGLEESWGTNIQEWNLCCFFHPYTGCLMAHSLTVGREEEFTRTHAHAHTPGSDKSGY